MIAIVDYGAGNLRSIQRALVAAGAQSTITSNLSEVDAADRIVLPGVGNAAAAMDRLRASGMADLVTARAEAGIPLLGVCLGMQLLFGDQEEGPTTGLGLLEGDVRALPADHKVPQMGWNLAQFVPGSPLSHLATSYFYFVHSYIVHPADRADVAAETDYGVRFPSIVTRDNIWGFQFHPEKSGDDGLSLVKAWVEWNP
ncbi:MAG TPA: imidazole glycerol phosphate synthase subunit HisH [Thermomicrobiales bacterium]|nr:imidazole glycerol phosphate synthase subunit HisH [Thermomicrobiales bacterium]